jgi:hypothetical protein
MMLKKRLIKFQNEFGRFFIRILKSYNPIDLTL